MADRFPAEVAEVLRTAGWSPGRRPDRVPVAVAVVCDQVGRHGARIESFSAVATVLDEFLGLQVDQDGAGRTFRRRPFTIDPTQVAATAETLADFGGLLGTRLFPIGFEGDHDSILAVDEAGRVFAIDHAGEWHLGNSVDEALITLITGTEPVRVDDQGRY
jgi:hypothetical protein